MKSYVAKVKVVCYVVFEAKDQKHAEKIVSKETWDLFDDLNAKNDAIELEEIQETLSVLSDSFERIED